MTRVLSLNFFIGSFSLIHFSLLTKKLHFKSIAQINISAVLFSAIVAIFAAFKGYGVWSLIIQSIVATIISVFLTWIKSGWKPRLKFKYDSLRELLGFSINLLGFNVVNYWMRRLEVLLIGKYIGSYELGIYSRAYNLMLLPLSQISWFIARVPFSVISEIQDDIERIKEIYLISTRTMALVTFPLMIKLFAVKVFLH
jgi:PST family polysaccharide transporter